MIRALLSWAAALSAAWGGADDPLPRRQLAEVRVLEVRSPGVLTGGRPAVRAWVGEPKRLAAAVLSAGPASLTFGAGQPEAAKAQALAAFARAWGAAEGQSTGAVCGSFQSVLPQCQAVEEPGAAVLTSDRQQAWLQQGADLAARGLEVLAVAEEQPDGLTLLGLLGLSDPVAEGVEEQLAALSRAGVEVQVRPGEQWPAGAYIGRQLGLTEAATGTAARTPSFAPAVGLSEVIETLRQARRGADNFQRQKNYLLASAVGIGSVLAGSLLSGRLPVSLWGLLLVVVLGLLPPAAALGLEAEAPGLMEGPYQSGVVSDPGPAVIQGLLIGMVTLLAAGMAPDAAGSRSLSFLTLLSALMMTAWSGRSGPLSLFDLPTANPALAAFICCSLLLGVFLTALPWCVTLIQGARLSPRQILTAALLSLSLLPAAELIRGLNRRTRS